jgi:hypothetical protein
MDRLRVSYCRGTSQRQLRQWVSGQSTHDRANDRCCPDYSCCRPELQAPREEREHYAALVEQGELWAAQRMRLRFLRRAATSQPEPVLSK